MGTTEEKVNTETKGENLQADLSSNLTNMVGVRQYGQLREFRVRETDWAIYKTRMKQFFIVHEIADDSLQRAHFLNALSEDSYKLLFNLCIPEAPEKKTYASLLEAFDKYFYPMKNVFPARYIFYKEVQEKGQSISEWAAHVQCLASKCEFQQELKIQLRDKFIMGLHHRQIMDRLFEEDATKLTFERAVEIAINKEAGCNHFQLSGQVKSESTEVFQLSRRNQGKGAPPANNAYQERSDHVESRVRKSAGTANKNSPCRVCGKKNHIVMNCYFKNAYCHSCGKKGHLRNVCKKFNGKSENYLNLENDVDLLFTLKDEKDSLIKCKVIVNGINFEFLLDTGASVSCISKRVKDFNFSSFPLIDTTKVLFGYNGVRIKPVGYIVVDMEFNNVKDKLKLFVIENGGSPLLGRDFFRKFNLNISLEKTGNSVLHIDSFQLVERLKLEFPKVFASENVLGCFNKGPIELKIAPSASPKFIKPRPLPYAL